MFRDNPPAKDPNAKDRSRKDARNAKDRARRAAKGLTRGDGGGAGKGQGRKPNPDRPPCVDTSPDRTACKLAKHGNRGWYCAKGKRGGCGVSLPK